MRRNAIIYCLIMAVTVTAGCSGMRGMAAAETVAVREHRDTVMIHDVRYDSVYVRQESHTDRSRDTVYLHDVSYEYRYRMLHDTVRVVSRDSIPYEVRVTEYREVPRRRNAIDLIAYCCLGLVAGAMLVKTVKMLKL